MRFANKNEIERLRNQYPAGCRVELLAMDDVQAPKTGTLGTVIGVDDTGSIMVHWDNGSGLNIVYGVDSCRKVSEWYKVWMVVPGSDDDAENGPCEPTWWNDYVKATSEADAKEVANAKTKADWETKDGFGFSEKDAGITCAVCTGAKRVTEEEYKAWKAEIDAFPEPPFK